MEKDKPTSAISNKSRPTSANSKSEFIKTLPIDLPVRDVIRRAHEAGFDVSKAYVHEIRASMRKTQTMETPQALDQQIPPAENRGEDKLQAAFSFASPEAVKAAAPQTNALAASVQSKREYIMSIPLDVPVRQILEDAHKSGFPVSKAYVHEIRSKLRDRAKLEPKRDARAGRAKQAAEDGSKSSDAKREIAFRRLVIELGTSRARSLLEQVEKKLSALILDD